VPVEEIIPIPFVVIVRQAPYFA